jgi:hypothetical protein
VDDILLAFKATGTLRKSLGDTSAQGQGSLASRLHAIRSSLDGDVGGIGEARSKGDRVADILSRVRTLTKKLDTPINVRDAAAVSTPVTASRGAGIRIGIGIAAPSSSSRYAESKPDSMGGDSRDEAVWSLVNPMHANPKSRVGTPAERGVGGLGGRGRARGEERGAVLKLSKPHRYSNSSGVEEETESDEGAEKQQDDGVSSNSNSGNRSSRQQVEGDRGRSLKDDTDEIEDEGADEKAVSRPTRAEGYASKDEVEHLEEKRDDKRESSDTDRLWDR